MIFISQGAVCIVSSVCSLLHTNEIIGPRTNPGSSVICKMSNMEDHAGLYNRPRDNEVAYLLPGQVIVELCLKINSNPTGSLRGSGNLTTDIIFLGPSLQLVYNK